MRTRKTAGGVTVSVLKKLVGQGKIDPDELVVAYITGNGLKTPDAVAGALPEPTLVAPSVEAFESAVSVQ